MTRLRKLALFSSLLALSSERFTNGVGYDSEKLIQSVQGLVGIR
jgi:hypothetical protein